MPSDSQVLKRARKHESAANDIADDAVPNTSRETTLDPIRLTQPISRTKPENRWLNGLDWPVVVWIGMVHIGALAAPFYFTWMAFWTFAVLAWFTGSVGVCLGYHRLLTHGSFVTYKPVRWLFAFFGGLSGEGSALTWVANHRKHHAFSDKDGDPHSPNDGTIWSHMLWFMPKLTKQEHAELCSHYAPDLYRDGVIRMLHTLFLPIHLACGVAMFCVGYFGWDLYTGISMVVWGMFVRLVYVFHITWLVNSATHLWGYRNYETTDNSRNLWWVGLLAFGEGWHNNHHAYQRMAKHGHKWWEVDMTYAVISLMEKTGLAWKVVKEIPARERPA